MEEISSQKLGAQITFSPDGPACMTLRKGPTMVMTVTLPQGDGDSMPQTQLPLKILPPCFKSSPQSGQKTTLLGWPRIHPPLVVELELGAGPVRLRQYPLSKDSCFGIKKHLHRLRLGILINCLCPWDSPLLLVRKPNSKDY